MQTTGSIEVGRRIHYPGDIANLPSDGLIVAIADTGSHFDAILFDGRQFNQVSKNRFAGLRPWQLLDRVHGPALIDAMRRKAAAVVAEKQTTAVIAAEAFQMAEASRKVDDPPVFFWNGIKDAKGAKLQKAWFSEMGPGGSTTGRFPPHTITIYARDYIRFSEKVRACFVVENNSDSMTDYFEQDHIRVVPGHPLYPQVKKALEAQQAHSAKRRA